MDANVAVQGITIAVNLGTLAILYYKIGRLEVAINGFLKPKLDKIENRVNELEKKVAAIEGTKM